LVLRVGGTLSASDFVLLVATIASLFLIRGVDSAQLRLVLWGAVAYQASILLTVVYNPHKSNLIEWFHEGILVMGGLTVGFVVGRRGVARTAVRAYMFLSVVIAVWACLFSATHGFMPANLPFGMQKNFVGDTLCFVVIVAYCRPDFLNLKRPTTSVVLAVDLVGMLASQSRAAILSCAAAIVFVLLRNRHLGRRSRMVVLALAPMLFIAYSITRNQLLSDNKFNSAYVRLSTFQQDLDIWHQSPWFGVGLRWWNTPQFVGAIQPPNVEFEMLTSAGVVGLLGLCALLFTMYQVSRRLDPRIGTTAVAILIARIVQGELDIFWVGAVGGFPFLICGLCIGADSLRRSTLPADSNESAELPVAVL
jgi:hypothetical protein